MLVTQKHLSYARSRCKKRIYFIGDVHAGTIAHSESNLDKAIATINKDDDALVVLMGDLGEFITPKDKRFDTQVISDWIDRHDIAHCEEQYIIGKFSKIDKAKIIGAIEGNHEISHKLYNNGDVHQHICDGLGIQNLGFSCFYDLIFSRTGGESHRYRLCLTHGSTGACTDSYKNTILTRWIDQNQADIYAYAHVHDVKYKARQYLGVDKRGKIVNREAMGVMTGCFFKTYVQGNTATYGERRNYPPVKLGYPTIEIDIPTYHLTFSEVVDLKQD